MDQPLVPPIHPDDDDDVVVALETARLEEERGAAQAAATWVQKAASAARKQGRPNRAGELSRAQAMLGLRAGRTTTTAPPPPPPMDDDFSEKTIVDRIQSLSARSDESSSNPEPGISPEPVAVLPEGVLRFPMRVAVRTMSDGRLDVRIFADAQTLQPGEVEAFLVQSLSGPGR